MHALSAIAAYRASESASLLALATGRKVARQRRMRGRSSIEAAAPNAPNQAPLIRLRHLLPAGGEKELQELDGACFPFLRGDGEKVARQRRMRGRWSIEAAAPNAPKQAPLIRLRHLLPAGGEKELQELEGACFPSPRCRGEKDQHAHETLAFPSPRGDGEKELQKLEGACFPSPRCRGEKDQHAHETLAFPSPRGDGEKELQKLEGACFPS
ncbi:MAG: hypothetical protein J0L88_07935, partial [Xanthomonadales bacterium]|nr:hypothetical protein [Xanthomonadales bacterium]